MRSPGLRAGLIGGAVLIVLNLIGLVPVPALGCLVLLLEVVILGASGALAASWLEPPRATGRAAGQGALAGLIGGVLGGVMSAVLAPVGLSLSGGSQVLVDQLPPESLQALQAAGLEPNVLFGPGTIAGITALCCLPTGLIAGAALGALGGVLLAAMNPGHSRLPLDEGQPPEVLPPE